MATADDTIDLVLYYTTAPRVYDGFGTVEIEPRSGRDHRGQILRKVGIYPDQVEWQTNRYASGMHAAVTPAEARKFPQLFTLDH